MVNPTPAADKQSVTVYYDGSCPICVREIGAYQNCAGADQLAWVDVSSTHRLGPAADLTREQALARFHVRRADGTLVNGGAAFAALWVSLPSLRWAGRLFQLPPFSWIIAASYNGFLHIRPHVQRLWQRL
jgi:predicted DCC family thiol-disulfide oxidoreductase YuxK